MRTAPGKLSLIALMFLLSAISITIAQNPPATASTGPATQGVGLIRNDPGAYVGYTLISPLQSKSTFLIDMNGQVVKTWATDSTPSSLAYLLESGNLLRSGLAPNPPFGRTAGGGGKMQEFNWNGELVWDFTYGTATVTQHHDFWRMPNGNVLLLVKEKKTGADAIAAGRIPSSAEGAEVQPDALVEIKPSGKTGGEVVWEWHLWDHLIQDIDKTKANFGDVAAHPERVDINYNVVAGQRANPDWTHFNAVTYNAELDQIRRALRGLRTLEIVVVGHKFGGCIDLGRNLVALMNLEQCRDGLGRVDGSKGSGFSSFARTIVHHDHRGLETLNEDRIVADGESVVIGLIDIYGAG